MTSQEALFKVIIRVSFVHARKNHRPTHGDCTKLETPHLSIVIPTLNEAECLPGLLADIHRQEGVAIEIICGDGGSRDATRAIIEDAGGRVLTGPPGRGRQMNLAAEHAAGEYLLFMHADSRIPGSHVLKNGLKALIAMIKHVGHDRVAGHFQLAFIRRQTGHDMAYRYIEGKTAFNRPNTTNGDQGFLMTARFFKALGCFETYLPFLEDQRLAEKIRRKGTWITLPGRLQTSSRRFEVEGFHRRYILMSIIMGLYTAGAEEFFNRARSVYLTQDQTGYLKLSPFFKIGWTVMRKDLGFWRSMIMWYRIGRFVRQNSWQMFYFLDVLHRREKGRDRPFLRFHDKYFGPLTDFRICDVATAIACFVWFLLILGPYFWVSEYEN